MKVKTSVTLSESLLQEIERLVNGSSSRSEFLELAAWAYLKTLQRRERDQRELELINRNADRLNRDVEDALQDQMPL